MVKMKLLTKLWNKILALDNQPLLNQIELLKFEKAGYRASLELEKEQHKATKELCEEKKKQYEKEIEYLEEEIEELSPNISKVNNDTYFKKKTEYYTWKPNKSIKLRDSLENFSSDTETMEKYLNFLNLIKVRNYTKVDDLVYQTVYKVQQWINDDDNYDTDKESFGVTEYWLSPKEAFNYYVTKEDEGDCFAEYEEIYTKTGLKKIKDIKENDLVLSYDFDKNKYVYKPVIKHWYKGKLQVNRVHFRNGQWLDVSENHPMWHRINKEGKSIYEKQYLSKIDLNTWYKRKVPIATKIPYIKSKPKLNKKLYRVIGHYIAEGWKDKTHISSSGYKLIEHIIPILEQNNIPFTEYTNNSGVPCINFLKSDFKEYLKPLKTNSFDISLPEELLTLPEDYLEELLYGMWLGDGTKNIGKNQNNKEWIYSTSSKQLADDIQRIGLQLGRTFHIWKQEHHGGVGKKPIYRITYNPKSHFLKNHGYDNISEVGISYIEKLNKVPMYDLTVKDTHTVIMKNGIITHQCEDLSAFLYGCIVTKLVENGFDKEIWRLKRVDVQILGNGGHALLAWLKDDLTWCPIETTFFKQYFAYNWRYGVDIFKSMYARIWHIFDEKSEYKLK